MSRHYHKGPDGWKRVSKKIATNLQYLQEIERKKKMPGPIVDPLGIPLGGNAQPQQNVGFNPVLQFLSPVFCQTIHDLLMGTELPATFKASPETIVDTAWEIANRAFQRLGFEFVFPMGVRLITPRELHEVQRKSAEAAEVAEKKESPND